MASVAGLWRTRLCLAGSRSSACRVLATKTSCIYTHNGIVVGTRSGQQASLSLSSRCLWPVIRSRASQGSSTVLSRRRQYSAERKTNDENTPSPTPSRLAERLRSSLAPRENIYTLPNFLTVSRLVAAPVIGYLVLHGAHAWALGLFAYAGITDLIDGWIARHYHQQTVVGTVIDPMADKTLMTVLTVCLAVQGSMPVYLATLILGRDVLLGIAAIYYRWISLPPPRTFSRYWDFSLPSAEVHPTGISKINTALQFGLIGATVAMPLVDVSAAPWILTAMTGLQYIVATTTVWSGASYIYSKDAVKILTEEEREQRIAQKLPPTSETQDSRSDQTKR